METPVGYWEIQKYQTFDKPEFQGFQYSSMNGVHRNHFQGIKKNQPAYKSAQAWSEQILTRTTQKENKIMCTHLEQQLAGSQEAST